MISSSALRVAEMLGMSLTELASLIGAARSSLTEAELNPIVSILAMTSEMAIGEERAAIWFRHQPIPGWAGKTAYDVVREGTAGEVLAYLEATRSGVYS